jgi:hypothetical protein
MADHPSHYLRDKPFRALDDNAKSMIVALQYPFDKLFFRQSVCAVVVHLPLFDR